KAQDCLENMGWRPDSSWFPLTPRQWKSVLRNEHFIGFVFSQGDCFMELHWRNFWDSQSQVNDRWARSISKLWQGCSYQAMSPSDLVLDLCSHGGIHGWIRAKWLGDMARIHAEGRVDWQAMLEQASKTDQEKALLACLRLLQEVYGIPLPDLPGIPWKNLPSFLIANPLHRLKDHEVPAFGTVQLMRRINYERLAVPQRTGRDLVAEFFHRRADFRVLHLPDRFFWAYIPLFPILWAWRRMMRYRLEI
ncbi:MAG: nucleotidyltransferase family protein, partial [Terracidiphilus sp.]